MEAPVASGADSKSGSAAVTGDPGNASMGPAFGLDCAPLAHEMLKPSLQRAQSFVDASLPSGSNAATWALI